MGDEKVKALPVKPKDNSGALMLVPPPVAKCKHYGATFEIDIDAGECTCMRCGGKVTPIFVLEQLMREESRWNRSREAYQQEMARLRARSSTKCRHCGKMTTISRR